MPCILCSTYCLLYCSITLVKCLYCTVLLFTGGEQIQRKELSHHERPWEDPECAGLSSVFSVPTEPHTHFIHLWFIFMFFQCCINECTCIFPHSMCRRWWLVHRLQSQRICWIISRYSKTFKRIQKHEYHQSLNVATCLHRWTSFAMGRRKYTLTRMALTHTL